MASTFTPGDQNPMSSSPVSKTEKVVAAFARMRTSPRKPPKSCDFSYDSLRRRHPVAALSRAAVHQCLELIKMIFIHSPRQTILLRADRSRHADNLAHAP